MIAGLMQPEPVRGVLVVEDEEQLLTLVASFLEGEHYSVFCARNGAEALEVFRAHEADIAVVLTDLGLPEVGGADLMTAVRHRKPTVKIIGLSGLSGGNVRQIALRSGADLFIAKPFHIEEIARAIRIVMGEA
jgi:DNA-binding response OmpR family regulator